MNKTNLIKKLAALVLLTTFAVTLAACGSKSLSTPYGSVGNTPYLTGAGYSITEKDLYNEMRLSSSSVLVEEIEKLLYKAELALVDAEPAKYAEDLVKYANEAIFGSSDIEALKKLDATTLSSKIASYIDSFYLAESNTALDPVADFDTTDFADHDAKILNFYKLNVAKKIYAKEQLLKDVKDKDASSYINIEKDLATYFDNNVKNQYDMSAITIRFVNLNEANATLRKFNIKTYRNQLYVIADPRGNTPVEGKAKEVLDSLGIFQYSNISDADYRKYYDKYQIDPSVSAGSNADVALDENETLVKFLEIYNYIYSYRDQVNTNYTVESILADLDNLPFTKSYEDYTNTSLRSYVYTTLGTEDGDTRFSANPRLSGSNYFLVFKLQGHDEEIQQWVDEDNKFIVYKNTGELTEKAQEIFDKIVESKLTTTYISAKATERINKADIVIYDELVKLYMAQSYKDVKLTSKSSKTLIAKVGDDEITVDAFYAKLEQRLGVSVAIDMAIRQTLKNTEKYTSTITSEKRAEYRKNIETIIKQFGQDYYASSGYPASMGRKNFLMLAFRAASIDEAIENVYVASALEEAYLKDIEGIYGDTIYEKFATYANKLRDRFFSLSSSHLLVYVDMDENDTPDDPAEYFETLDATEKAAFQAKLVEFMNKINDRARDYSSLTTGMNAIVEEFNASGRIGNSGCTVAPLDPTPECRWAEYKALGFNLKFENLPAINNNTNITGSTSALDEKFYAGALEVYAEVKAIYDDEKTFPSQWLVPTVADYDGILESSFGWHMILSTGGGVAVSSKFTKEDDTFAKDGDQYKIYEHIEYTDANDVKYYLDAYSDTDAISANQVQIYLNEKDSEYGVENLPTAVSNAISAYFAPIHEKFTGSQNQLNMLYRLFNNGGFTFANAANTTKAQRLITINQSQFFSYVTDNEEFQAVYGDWFTDF
ncbi:hypothetical protein N7603_01655 [Acholeplasma vituli]|uniref:Uncharacterized protein n=1 Tax=Paracholeplasma vituli TaxID=69473 RepID=A0ABT2PUD3_9MOLU|nr:hypothetical protein [Paracholeplasma vituli]MCU0104358.1 hypothetical protein [Paracholeplasma vituli]